MLVTSKILPRLSRILLFWGILPQLGGFFQGNLAREEIQQLQKDIAKSYEGKAIAGRIIGGAAIAFAGAAILSMVVQYSTNQKVDIKPVIQSGGQAAAYGGAGALADGVLYKIGVEMGKTVQEAKAFAQQGVTAGFCILAVAADAINEFKSYRDGEIKLNDAIAGSSIKAALDLLPMITAPLGLLGIPICVGAQIGGRWIISKIRAEEEKLKAEIELEFEKTRKIDERINNLINMSDETDKIFESLGLNYKPQLRLVK